MARKYLILIAGINPIVTGKLSPAGIKKRVERYGGTAYKVSRSLNEDGHHTMTGVFGREVGQIISISTISLRASGFYAK